MNLSTFKNMISNRYPDLSSKELEKYLLKDLKNMVKHNKMIILTKEEAKYLIILNQYKIEDYLIKLIENNNLNIKMIIEELSQY